MVGLDGVEMSLITPQTKVSMPLAAARGVFGPRDNTRHPYFDRYQHALALAKRDNEPANLGF
jgi:hypothetical protein